MDLFTLMRQLSFKKKKEKKERTKHEEVKEERAKVEFLLEVSDSLREQLKMAYQMSLPDIRYVIVMAKVQL